MLLTMLKKDMDENLKSKVMDNLLEYIVTDD